MAKINRQDILNVIYADGNIEPTLQYMTDNITEVVNGLDDAINLTDNALTLLADQVATNTVDIASILAISYPNVNTFADLPNATLNLDKLYVVKTTTGRINPFATTRWSGLYKSDGITWNFLGIDIPAIQQLVDNLANSLATVATSGDYNDLNNLPTIPPVAPVDSVNGQTGVVVLDKSDVGLSNVDNTSDINKPISTATQTALNLKYDASNPNGYETPAQLNTRDTNNRNRANHTGTQLSSTISDFAATVRSTVLTGLSLATSTAVTATDSILISIGKLQAQLNAKVYGTEFESFQSTSSFSSSSPAFVLAAGFTTTSKSIGLYRISVDYNLSIDSTSGRLEGRLVVDGVDQKTDYISRTGDINSRHRATTTTYINFGTVSTHTIELFISRAGLGSTVTLNDVTFEIWRVS